MAVVLLASFVLSACTGRGDQSFSAKGYPFTFDYPASWTLTHGPASSSGENGALRSLSVALKEPYDQVTIMQYELKKTLPRGANGFRPEIDRIVERLTKHAGGSSGRARVVRFGGVPGYQYVVKYPVAGGVKLQNTMTFLFRGKHEFQIVCQSIPENRQQLMRGCEKILDTLEFE